MNIDAATSEFFQLFVYLFLFMERSVAALVRLIVLYNRSLKQHQNHPKKKLKVKDRES